KEGNSVHSNAVNKLERSAFPSLKRRGGRAERGRGGQESTRPRFKSSGRTLEAAGEAGNRQRNLLRLGRLGNVLLITRGERTPAVGIARVSSEGDGRCESGVAGRAVSDFIDQAITVFARHADVGHDNVGPERAQFIERLIDGSRHAGCCPMLS